MMLPQSASVGHRIADSDRGVTLDAQQHCCRPVWRRGSPASMSVAVTRVG
jgi:hypothetical protein